MISKAVSAGDISPLLEAQKRLRSQLPATWKELHSRYLTWNGERDWPWLMGDFIPRISNTKSCQCRMNFQRWVFDHNVDWRDPFAWSVEAHNAVNARIGRPVLTVEVARDLHGPHGELADPSASI
jgi:hypothetical protein